MEYREAPNEGADYADAKYVGISRSAEKPDGRCRRSHEQDAVNLSPIRGVFVLMTLVVVVVICWQKFFRFAGIPYGSRLLQFHLGHDKSPSLSILTARAITLSRSVPRR
jgi:hypothetical protein